MVVLDLDDVDSGEAVERPLARLVRRVEIGRGGARLDAGEHREVLDGRAECSLGGRVVHVADVP
jgi:hypothetical protein